MKKKKVINWWMDTNYHSAVSAWLTQGITDGGTPPSGTILTALSTFMTTLDEYGLGPSGSRMKTMNIMHTGSKPFAKINIKNVATFKYTEVNTVAFSDGNGCRSNGFSSYFNQGFKSDAFTGTQLTFINYVSESNTSDAAITTHGFRVNSASNAISALFPKTTTNSTQAYMSSTTPEIETNANTNHRGLYIHTLVNVTSTLYTNGVKSSAVVTVVAPNISCDRLVLARNSATVTGGVTPLQYYNKYVALDAIYDQYSDTDAANFKTAFDTYKSEVGLP